MSEYDPVFSSSGPPDPGDPRASDDLERVREVFEQSARPYLRHPWVWWSWGLVLPLTAGLHRPVLERFGLQGVILLWSLAILAGGAVEMGAIFRSRGRGRRTRSTPLVSWVFRIQGNLSVTGLAISALLVWQGLAWALPGLWLLLVGHSFYLLGGLAFRPLRIFGLFLQAGALAALWPGASALAIFAGVTGAGSLWLGVQIFLRSRAEHRSTG